MYFIEYVEIKEYVKIYSVNPLPLIFGYVNGYFEVNGNKYSTLVPTNTNKIRDLIRSITKDSDDYNYDEKYMKIKFHLYVELSLNKTVEIPTITIVVRAIFLENNKYYPQVFLDECLYEI